VKIAVLHLMRLAKELFKRFRKRSVEQVVFYQRLLLFLTAEHIKLEPILESAFCYLIVIYVSRKLYLRYF